MLIEKREEALQSLRCMHGHLVPGGRLILDLFLPDPLFEIGKVTTSTFPTANDEVILIEKKLVEVDFFNRYSVSYLKYEKWRRGSLIQTELQRFAIRWFGCEEFKLVLQDVGFSDIVVSADYVYGKPPSNARQMLTFEAVRK